jgi:hypothetical protein
MLSRANEILETDRVAFRFFIDYHLYVCTLVINWASARHGMVHYARDGFDCLDCED